MGPSRVIQKLSTFSTFIMLFNSLTCSLLAATITAEKCQVPTPVEPQTPSPTPSVSQSQTPTPTPSIHPTLQPGLSPRTCFPLSSQIDIKKWIADPSYQCANNAVCYSSTCIANGSTCFGANVRLDTRVWRTDAEHLCGGEGENCFMRVA